MPRVWRLNLRRERRAGLREGGSFLEKAVLKHSLFNPCVQGKAPTSSPVDPVQRRSQVSSLCPSLGVTTSPALHTRLSQPWEESPWSWGSSPLHLTSTLVQPVCRLHNPVAKWPSLRNIQEHRATEGQPSAKSLPSLGRDIKSCKSHQSSTHFGEQAPSSDRSACAALVFSHKPSLETWKPLLD